MTSDETTALTVDLLVIGGGMAGMSAAAYAAARGAVVGVVEKGPDIGGSAKLAAGGLACPVSVEAYLEQDPGGDPQLLAAMLSGYDDAVEWVRSTGVHVGQAAVHPEVMGVPCTITHHDVIGYLERCKVIVSQHDGWVVTGAEVLGLTIQDGAVRGARMRDRDGDVEVTARWVLLASGGFMHDPDLRDRYIGGAAGDMIVRANTYSDGTGLRLGLDAGAATSAHMDGFYGHTVPYPLKRYGQSDFRRMSQHLLGVRCVLLNREGRRFVDESRGYYRNAQAVIHQAGSRALLVGDNRLREFDIVGGDIGRALGLEQVDKVRQAIDDGANVVIADDLQELSDGAAEFGYAGVAEAIAAFNADLASGAALDPPRDRYRDPVEAAPYFAVEVQPVITNTFGGLRINVGAQVLDESGQAVPGLLAAGGDAGGVYHRGYGGGLSAALIFGLAAARTALTGLPVTSSAHI